LRRQFGRSERERYRHANLMRGLSPIPVANRLSCGLSVGAGSGHRLDGAWGVIGIGSKSMLHRGSASRQFSKEMISGNCPIVLESHYGADNFDETRVKPWLSTGKLDARRPWSI